MTSTLHWNVSMLVSLADEFQELVLLDSPLAEVPILVFVVLLASFAYASLAGYSWKTNQYGLGIDNVISYELVRPDGHVVSVTATSHPDLFFALRGGGNNFVSRIHFLWCGYTHLSSGDCHQIHLQDLPSNACLGTSRYILYLFRITHIVS